MIAVLSLLCLIANVSGQCRTSTTASTAISVTSTVSPSGLPPTSTAVYSLFFNLANGSCLRCPSTCVTCLTIVDDVTNPCSACQPGLGLFPNTRSTLSPGGSCTRCSSLGLLESRGSSRLRLVSTSSVTTTTDASSSGGSVLEGRLEVYYSGQWWAVCDDRWTLTNADIVCREMSLGSGMSFVSQYDAAHMTSSSLSTDDRQLPPPIGFNFVNCSVDDTSFFDCRQAIFYGRRKDCQYFETVGIRCSGPHVPLLCTPRCPLGQLSSTNGSHQCVDCPSELTGCLSCVSVNKTTARGLTVQCIRCESPLVLLQLDVYNETGSPCVAVCPPGQFSNISAGTCQPCGADCATCTLTTSGFGVSVYIRCTSCHDVSAILYNGTCVRTCPSGLLALNYTSGSAAGTAATCVSQCPSGLYANTTIGHCLRCSEACFTCRRLPSNCTACAVGRVLVSAQTGSGLVSSCLADCPVGYYAGVDTRCRRCADLRCAKCYSGGTYCAQCLDPADSFELGRCVATCSLGLYPVSGFTFGLVDLTSSKLCLPVCPDGQYLDMINADCLTCSSFCRRCVSATVCLECQKGYFVDTIAGQCVNQCPSMSTAFTSTSLSSVPDFRVIGGRLPLDGIVETTFNGSWSRVCGQQWTMDAASVICSHLGLGDALLAHVAATPAAVTLNCTSDGHCERNVVSNCSIAAVVRCSGVNLQSLKLPSTVCLAANTSPSSCLAAGEGGNQSTASYCQSCPLGMYGNGASCRSLISSRSQLKIIYPKSSTNYLTNWPQGVELSLPCVVGQPYSVNFTWLKNGAKLADSPLWRVSQPGILTLFSPTWRSHAGSYQCLVNDTDSTQTRTFVVSIQERLQIVNPPINQNGSGPFMLDCGYTGKPTAQVSWMINEQTLSTDTPYVAFLSNGSLFIQYGLPQFQGYVTCIVQNSVELLSASATISITGPPAIVNSQPVTIALMGDPLILACLATGSTPLKLYWQKNNETVFNDSTTTVFSNGTLLVRNMTDNAAGLFTCLATSIVFDDVMATWNTVVVVMIYPTVSITPNTDVVNISQSATFTCAYFGRPQPTLLYWRLPNGTVLINAASQNTGVASVTQTSSSSTTIAKTTGTDYGNVSCTVSSIAGRATAVASLVVIGQPRFVRPPTDTVLFAGWPSVLDWSVSTLEQPAIAWYINGTYILPIAVNTSGMFFTPRCGIDAGNYTVKAVNVYGLTSASAFVQVICNYPLPTVMKVGSNTVRLSIDSSVPAAVYSSRTAATTASNSSIVPTLYLFEIWVVTGNESNNFTQPDVAINPLHLQEDYFLAEGDNYTYAVGTYIAVIVNSSFSLADVTVGDEMEYLSDSLNKSVFNYALAENHSYAIVVRTLSIANDSKPTLVASTDYLVVSIRLPVFLVVWSTPWWEIFLIVLAVIFGVMIILLLIVCLNFSRLLCRCPDGGHTKLSDVTNCTSRACECVGGSLRRHVMRCFERLRCADEDLSATDDRLIGKRYRNEFPSYSTKPPASTTDVDGRSVRTSTSTLFIPTEDEIERLEKIGINYYEEDDGVSKSPIGISTIKSPTAAATAVPPMTARSKISKSGTRPVSGATELTAGHKKIAADLGWGSKMWRNLREAVLTKVFKKRGIVDIYSSQDNDRNLSSPAEDDDNDVSGDRTTRHMNVFRTASHKLYVVTDADQTDHDGTTEPRQSAFKVMLTSAARQLHDGIDKLRYMVQHGHATQSVDLDEPSAKNEDKTGHRGQQQRSAAGRPANVRAEIPEGQFDSVVGVHSQSDRTSGHQRESNRYVSSASRIRNTTTSAKNNVIRYDSTPTLIYERTTTSYLPTDLGQVFSNPKNQLVKSRSANTDSSQIITAAIVHAQQSTSKPIISASDLEKKRSDGDAVSFHENISRTSSAGGETIERNLMSTDIETKLRENCYLIVAPVDEGSNSANETISDENKQTKTKNPGEDFQEQKEENRLNYMQNFDEAVNLNDSSANVVMITNGGDQLTDVLNEENNVNEAIAMNSGHNEPLTDGDSSESSTQYVRATKGKSRMNDEPENVYLSLLEVTSNEGHQTRSQICSEDEVYVERSRRSPRRAQTSNNTSRENSRTSAVNSDDYADGGGKLTRESTNSYTKQQQLASSSLVQVTGENLQTDDRRHAMKNDDDNEHDERPCGSNETLVTDNDNVANDHIDESDL